MLKDNRGRTISYIRFSITDKCNLHCRYCRDESGVPIVSHSDILTLEQIETLSKKFVQKGVSKIRLTGGEPLVRRGVVWLVEKLARIDGLTDLSMTTNGSMLPKFAEPLFRAGLGRINISLDTLDPTKYNFITRDGQLSETIAGIDAAIATGFKPIKINTVLIKNFNDSKTDIKKMRDFCKKRGIIGRFIREMSLKKGSWSGLIGDPKSDVGLCHKCNKLRVDCFGRVYPCLFSDRFVPITAENFDEALVQILRVKPKEGSYNKTLTMRQIGG